MKVKFKIGGLFSLIFVSIICFFLGYSLFQDYSYSLENGYYFIDMESLITFGIWIIIVVFLFIRFKKNNQGYFTYKKIKKKGNLYSGEVVRIIQDYYNNPIGNNVSFKNRFIVQFVDNNNQVKYFITPELNDFYLKYVMKDNSLDNNLVEITSHYYDGFISWTLIPTKEHTKVSYQDNSMTVRAMKVTKRVVIKSDSLNTSLETSLPYYTYKGSLERNFPEKITCTVYELDGKYVYEDMKII